MLGTIIGEIAGSTDEVREVKLLKELKGKSDDEVKIIISNLSENYLRRKSILLDSTPLFDNDSSYTDDTVLTLAIANKILTNGSYEENLRKFGLREINLGLDKYGRSRFGKGFCDWLKGNYIGESYGNGCAMRVSAIANYYDDLSIILKETYDATYPSHNHKESYNAAGAVSACIYLTKKKYSKEYIKKYIEEEFHYDLNFDLENLEQTYKFTSRASDSVPQAIYCFLVSNSFEDAIRKAISIGGDSDTIAAITGSIAENYYGIDSKLISEVEKYLPEYIINIVNDFYVAIGNDKPFKNLIKDFFKEQHLYSEEFFDFIKNKVKKLPYDSDLSWYGCFPLVENGTLKDIGLLVPDIKNEENILVNIHEYTHALDLFNKLGSIYDEQVEEYEKHAKEMEKVYKLKKPIE